MSNTDFYTGQQQANAQRLWDDHQNGRRASSWEAYAHQLEARIDFIHRDRDAAIVSWKKYTDRIEEQLRVAKAELLAATTREAALRERISALESIKPR